MPEYDRTMMDPTRLKALRGLRGWTQAQLSAASGVSQGTVSRLERGDSKGLYGDTQRALAGALGTSVAYLLGQTDDPTPDEHAQPDAPDEAPQAAPDEGDALDVALGRAFDARRFTVADLIAARDAVRGSDRRTMQGVDLTEAALGWLSAAKRLRLDGVPATPANVLLRASTRTTDAVAAERAAAANAAGDQALRALGVEKK